MVYDLNNIDPIITLILDVNWIARELSIGIGIGIGKTKKASIGIGIGIGIGKNNTDPPSLILSITICDN